MRNKFFYTLFILVFSLTLATAQKAKLKKAKKKLDRNNIYEAVELYLSILDKTESAEAQEGIAECYWRIKDMDEVVYWYGLILTREPENPTALIRQAKALHAKGMYDKAKKTVQLYLEIDPGSSEANALLKSCSKEEIVSINEKGKYYDIENCKALNSGGNDYAPQYYKNGIVVVSDREVKPHMKVRDNSTKDGRAFTEVFFAKRTQPDPDEFEFRYGKVGKFNKKVSSKYHDGPLSFSSDFSEMYISRTNMTDRSTTGFRNFKIYYGQAKGKDWDKLKGLSFNSAEYNVFHPAVSPDGTMLFFSSDMPAGFGGKDLYVSYLEDGRWSQPINLGPTVNTEGNEVFPFVHEDSTTNELTLYFSSDGLTGLGGMDIFFTKEVYSGSWIDPVNLGAPINSSADDFSFVTSKDKTTGYLASNRDGGLGGDDIYSFKKLSVTIEGRVYDEKENSIAIEGAEVFCPVIPEVKIITDADGKFFVELPLNKATDFIAEKFGYQPNTVRIAKVTKPGKTVHVNIPLRTQCTYTVEGTVIDGMTNEPLADASVTLKSFCAGEEDKQELFSDENGKFEFKQIREDCDIQVIIKKAGFADGSVTFRTGTECGENAEPDSNLVQRIPLFCYGQDCDSLKGDDGKIDPSKLGEGDVVLVDERTLEDGSIFRKYSNGGKDSCIVEKTDGTILLVDCDNPDVDNPIEELVATGKKIKLENIYYDFDDARIRDDAKPALRKLANFLKANPDLKIELSAHTDARGRKLYNKRLSKRRAESVVRYLIENGISKRRLKAKGFGEKVMVNGCYDGVECSEEQHQENRRTEFMITGFANGKKKVSVKPSNILTNPCSNCNAAPDLESDEVIEEVEEEEEEFDEDDF